MTLKSGSLKVIETGAIRNSYPPSIVTMAIFVAVSEIFSVKEWCDLENRVRVHSRSLEMAPFDRSHPRSYSPSIVTMALSCIVCEIYSDLLVENSKKKIIPHLYLSPSQGVTLSEFRKGVWMQIKLECLGYRMVKKI